MFKYLEKQLMLILILCLNLSAKIFSNERQLLSLDSPFLPSTMWKPVTDYLVFQTALPDTPNILSFKDIGALRSTSKQMNQKVISIFKEAEPKIIDFDLEWLENASEFRHKLSRIELFSKATGYKFNFMITGTAEFENSSQNSKILDISSFFKGKSFPNVEGLTLGEHSLSVSDLSKLFKTFSNLRSMNLVKATLAKNKLDFSEKSLIHWQHNSNSKSAINYIANNISYLNFGGNRHAFLSLLKRVNILNIPFNRLKCLKISGIPWTSNLSTSFYTLVQKNFFPVLEELVVNNNFCEKGQFDRFLESTFPKSLKIVNLSNKDLTEAQLLKFIKHNPHIKKIELNIFLIENDKDRPTILSILESEAIKKTGVKIKIRGLYGRLK